jgi:hypothetical protein
MTIRGSRPHVHPQKYAIIALAVAISVLGAGLVFNWFLAHDHLIVWDFHAPWLALRSMLHDGLNPYGDEVTERIQLASYGRPAYSYEDQRAMAYPLSITVFIGPLTGLPLPAAQGMWVLLLATALVAFVAVAPRATGWQPPLWLMALTTVFTLGLYPTVWAMILGQVSVLISTLVALAWWGLRSQRWVLAGICLALATVKPQMVFLLVPGVVVWALYQRRWQLMASFVGTLAAIVVLPMLWLRDWPSQWVQQSLRYASSTFFDPPLVVVTGSAWASWPAAGLLLAWAIYWWWHASQRDVLALGWAPAMLVTIAALVAPRTHQANQVILLLPLFYVFGHLRSAAVVAVEVLLIAGIWLVAVAVLPFTGDPQHTLLEHRLISPILPVGLAAALLILTPVRQREVV